MIRCALVFIAVASTAPSVTWAGPAAGYAGQSRVVESTVREVDTTWQTVYLADGTLLSTNDVKLLEQLKPGMRIRAAFEERQGSRNFINRVEVLQ
jgi:hypothetical protein